MQPTVMPFKTNLPLSKVIRIMKLYPDVKLVSKDAAKCVQLSTELFLKNIILKSYEVACDSKRKTIQPNDLYKVLKNDEIYSFLEEE